MASKLIVFTLGFDTRFQMKTLTRIRVGEDDKVLIVRVDEVHEQVDAAERDLVRFVKDILGVEVHVLRVNVYEPHEAIPAIASRLVEFSPVSKIIADLSGGMRVLVLETLAALLSTFPPSIIDIIVWTENLREMVALNPRSFNIPRLDELSLHILEELDDGVPRSLKELVTLLGKPKTTIYHKLRGLVSEGLVEEMRRPGTVLYVITSSGRLALRFSKALSRIGGRVG